ncbi:MAG TPA: hypothetical protein VNP72_07930, partial [Longimicrobium sp.]|nr:hypothetical protein [Longimicrobium sp.]
LVLMTTFVVAAFYCLEALSSERRDRSVLFWKSLPVSDRTTVLAKATIPLGVLPLITVAAVVATQLAIFLISAVTLLVLGQGVAPLWGELHLFRLWTAMLYGVDIMMLWHAPVYGFLLLVSGWARRTAVLWAVLPLLALGVVEKLTMNTAYVASMVTYRLLGWYGKAFAIPAREEIPFSPLNRLTPGRILGSADLWLGLAFAALCLAAAARLRRQREPG